MAERPILFSAPMVKALLAGRKTQTRRIAKRQDLVEGGNGIAWLSGQFSPWLPPYEVGDLLWVREAWNIAFLAELAPGESLGRTNDECCKANGGFACPCGDGIVFKATSPESHPQYGLAVWRSPTHMPRWASRITLKVTGVKVERLQAISEEDAEAEGVEQCARRVVGLPGGCSSFVCGFQQLWHMIHGPGSWDANPWVAAISFERVATPDTGEGR